MATDMVPVSILTSTGGSIMKKKARKLTLQKATVHILTARDLASAAGGIREFLPVSEVCSGASGQPVCCA